MRKEDFCNLCVLFVVFAKETTGQDSVVGCDTVADFSVTERRGYSFNRPNSWQHEGRVTISGSAALLSKNGLLHCTT